MGNCDVWKHVTEPNVTVGSVKTSSYNPIPMRGNIVMALSCEWIRAEIIYCMALNKLKLNQPPVNSVFIKSYRLLSRRICKICVLEILHKLYKLGLLYKVCYVSVLGITLYS